MQRENSAKESGVIMGDVAMTCAVCGYVNHPGSQVCLKCGEASWVLENGYAHAPDPEPEQPAPAQISISGAGVAGVQTPKRRGRRG